jgi:apolipoprotein N-acyltransferase
VGTGASPWELTKLLAVTLLPFSVVGPLAGVLIDRWDRRRIMVAVSVARVAIALAAIGVLVVDSQPLALVGVLVLLSASRFVVAAKGAALPRLVRVADLVAANALASVGGMVAAFSAAVIGSVFVEAAPPAGFIGAAALYAAAAVSFARLPGVGGGERDAVSEGWARLRREIADQVRAVAANPGVRRPMLAVWTHRMLLGFGFILLVLIADSRYGFEASGYGLALAVTGLGAFVGTWSAPVLGRRFRPTSLIPLTFWAAGLVATVAGFRPEFATLIAGIGLVALAFQVLKILADALVQHAAPDVVRGRVVSVYDTGYNVAFVLAGLVLVPLWEPGRAQALLWVLAGGFTIGGLVFARSLGVWPSRPPAAGAADRARDRSDRRWPTRGAAVIVGTLPVLAFPEADWWPLGFVGLVPLMALVIRSPTGREAGVLGWMGGTGFFVAMHHWLLGSVGAFVVPLGLALGLLWIPWARIARATMGAHPRPGAALVLVPAAWVAAEFIRSWDRLGGPWGVLGASQWDNPLPRALAAVGGVWLVSVALVAVNVAVTLALSPSPMGRARLQSAALAGGLVVVVFAGGAVVPGPDAAGEITVAGVQTGRIDGPATRFDAHVEATRGLVGEDLDLVVWPESSVGFDLEDDPARLARLAALSDDLGVDLLVNVDAQRGEGGIFKSSVLVGPDGVRARYDKTRLVPFGEAIPLRPLFGWVTALTPAADENRRRGDELVVMGSAGIGVGPLVCFESTFPDLGRRLAEQGADLIVLQTATTTFQGSWAHDQHASLAALRAVEAGRPMMHAALSGTTAAFDADGERRLWMGHDETGTWMVDLPLSTGRTVYAVLGDWVPLTAFSVLFVATLVVGLGRARRDEAAPETGDAVAPDDA